MKIPADCPPLVMDGDARRRMRADADRATQLYPGPVGELVARELLSWAEFGYVLGPDALLRRVVAELDVEAARQQRAAAILDRLRASESAADGDPAPVTPTQPR